MTHEQSAATRGGERATSLAMPGSNAIPEFVSSLADMANNIQTDFMTLWNRRAEAYLDLPQRVAACRTLGDLIEEQTKFLVVMQRHYAEYVDHMTRAIQNGTQQMEESAPKIRNGNAKASEGHRQRAA